MLTLRYIIYLLIYNILLLFLLVKSELIRFHSFYILYL